MEAPYILQAGLPASSSLTADGKGGFLAGGDHGVVRIGGDAKLTTVSADPVVRLSGPVVLAADGIHRDGIVTAAPGAVDILARDGGVLVLYPDHLDWWPPVGAPEPIGSGLTGARALGEQVERHVYVLTDTAVYDTADLHTPLQAGLVDPRAVAADARGRVYVVQGEPPELWRIDGTNLTLIARFLGDVGDAAFGAGDLLPTDTLYLLKREGEIDYLRPP